MMITKNSKRWSYFYLENGIIVDENGWNAFPFLNPPIFANEEQANFWLDSIEFPGTVLSHESFMIMYYQTSY